MEIAHLTILTLGTWAMLRSRSVLPLGVISVPLTLLPLRRLLFLFLARDGNTENAKMVGVFSHVLLRSTWFSPKVMCSSR